MKIQDMFADDINRKINGVIKVDQSDDAVIEQELNEYIITNELRKHFMQFFNCYCDALDEPTADIGVWISGFFGSGKSHFLKMLSYLLENKEVNGVRSVERLRDKFEDPGTFMQVDRAAKVQTETLLFNISIEGSITKDKTAVLRVFAKMFYDHLGFFGDNLKVAKVEQYIDRLGKTEEFRRAFEDRKGMSWLECRKAFAFHRYDVISTLVEVLGAREEDVRDWFNDKAPEELSIAQLVDEMKEYLKSKPKNYRLLFMIDEVGQYIGTDTNLLLNLQSMVEKIGSECEGKIWVICTGQEAIDEVIKVRDDEFSRIQARFKTRLSLSSSTVDEVIQKRILKKKENAAKRLAQVYEENDSVMRNLFTFSNSILDIKGYSGPSEFAVNFPFVPYQFTIMQKVFAEIRKHGNSGKHLSGGERSMLSGFQEAAQSIQDKNEYALVPLALFYDTVHTFLDSSIRRVIERCQKAADNGDGIMQKDVDVLKLLYLIRYIDDIAANLDNIVILMADDIRMDKITMRASVGESLERLLAQNYISRSGDLYNFLTDEEQDIQREISKTYVDTSEIVAQIGQMIFGDIFTTKKFRYGNYDFAFDQKVDGITFGSVTGGMQLHFLTVATDGTEKTELRLMTDSKGREAIVALADTPYYESLENALKIRKYVKQRNVNQLPKSVQNIIRNQQEEATRYEQTAMAELEKAIVTAEFYADGEHLSIKGGTAKSQIDQVLEYLVAHVYSELELIDEQAENDADILAILTGKDNLLPGHMPNRGAVTKVEEYLEIQAIKKLPTSMADIQSRYQSIPYGWREIDIAAVVARLIRQQKVTVKYAGANIQADDSKLPDMLRKKSEIGKTSIGKRQMIALAQIHKVKAFLRDYLDVMDIPEDEDGVVKYAIEKLEEKRLRYEELSKRYSGHHYPDQDLVTGGIQLLNGILLQHKDNQALVKAVLDNQDALVESKEGMKRVEEFFKNQVQVFDASVTLIRELQNDLDYLHRDQESQEALNQICIITEGKAESGMVYRRIPELNGLMATVHFGHDRLLESKRAELLDIVRQCMESLQAQAGENDDCQRLIQDAHAFYEQKKKAIGEQQSLALLDAQIPKLWSFKDEAVKRIEQAKQPPAAAEDKAPELPGFADVNNARKNIKTIYRQAAFPAKTLASKEDVDAYVESIRSNLMKLLQNCDGIKLN